MIFYKPVVDKKRRLWVVDESDEYSQENHHEKCGPQDSKVVESETLLDDIAQIKCEEDIESLMVNQVTDNIEGHKNIVRLPLGVKPKSLSKQRQKSQYPTHKIIKLSNLECADSTTEYLEANRKDVIKLCKTIGKCHKHIVNFNSITK